MQLNTLSILFCKCIFYTFYQSFSANTLKTRRSNEVAPEAAGGANQAVTDAEQNQPGDCQRVKQVPLNPSTGT